MGFFGSFGKGLVHVLTDAGHVALAGLTGAQGQTIALNAIMAVVQAELTGGSGADKLHAATQALLGVAESQAIPLLEGHAKDIVQEVFDNLLKH